MSTLINVGVVGGSGYTGGELLRILIAHPQVRLSFVYSTTRAGKKLTTAHPDLLGETDMAFSGTVDPDADVVFLCLGHGNSKAFLDGRPFSDRTKIIDLSNDFRLGADAVSNGRTFVYGLPELSKPQIRLADNIANPGCFATAIQLALLPLAKAGALQGQIHVNAITGSTGAGIKPSATTHFSWRNNNASWYKPFTHQHLGEIGESLASFGSPVGQLLFLPNRGNFARGILATAYTKFNGSLGDARALYDAFYADAPFTQLADDPIHLKQVANTNQCHLHLHQHGDVLLATSAIDNLIKGASGQAVQNMNLMLGLDETTGLRLKASAF